jgi:16S rRNA (guanine966-N2)-methyltransferase
MRIIAGSLGGRNFDAPKGDRTHPMSDKARGGMFNSLGDIDGLTALDAFAGSGALSFEALSRGASHALLIESDRKAQKTIEENIKALGLKQAKLVKAKASSWSDNNEKQQFDLVLLDPPYDDLQLQLVQKLTRHVNNNGLLVLAWPGNLTPPELTGFKQIKQNQYGDAQLIFYRPL